MTTYKIEPRVKRRWFRENELWYDLIKETWEEEWIDPSFGNGHGAFLPVRKTETIFSSQKIEEIETVIKNLKTK